MDIQHLQRILVYTLVDFLHILANMSTLLAHLLPDTDCLVHMVMGGMDQQALLAQLKKLSFNKI